MIFYINFSLILTIINSCSFSSYEEALIPISRNFSKFSHMIPALSDNDSFGFGYWTLHRSKMEFLNDLIYYPLLTIFDQEMIPVIFVNQIFLEEEKKYLMSYAYIDMNYDGNQITLEIPFNQYSDHWIFTLFTLKDKFQTLILEMTGQQTQIIKINTPLFQQKHIYDFYIGDYFSVEDAILFSGRLSQMIFFENYVYNSDTFEYLSDICKIPPLVIGETSVPIISSITNFQGNKFFQTSLTQVGRKYCVTGWVKYSILNIAVQIQQILLRISANKYKNFDKVFGDDLFKLSSFLSKQQPQKSKIAVTIDAFCSSIIFQQICQQDVNINGVFMNFYFEIINTEDISLYEGLQQWHYFQYEYGREINEQFELLFQIYFFNQIGYFQKSISDEIINTSWSNDLFYIFISEKNNQFDNLQAEIYNLNFIHNYDQNKEFLLVCHKTCKTCKGPFVNDCLSCYDSQERFLFEETNQCYCKDGFSELEKGSSDCFTLDNIFFTIEKQQVLIEKQSKCQQGYFLLSVDNQTVRCIKCPQQQINQYSCYDCLVGSDSWSKSLVCSQDLISRGLSKQDGFFLQDRLTQFIDVYFLDKQYNLIYLPGYQGYCDLNLNQENCFLIQTIKNKYNIDQGGFCKPNYFQYQGECLIRDYECLQFDIKGDCIKCQDNQYLKNKRCFNCPSNCLNCYYNLNQQQLQCLKCYNQYAFLNGECQKCGKYCQICQEEFVDIKKNSHKYLKCLKCIDDSEYFITSEYVNCNKNEIKACKYIVQVTSLQIGNLFIPDSDESTRMTICAMCQSSPIYDLQKKECIMDPVTIQNNENIQQLICMTLIKGPSEICLKSVKQNSPTFIEQCNILIQNCALCQTINSLVSEAYICLLCTQGYFADRLSGQCQVCPQELNCLDCGQQYKISKDYWIYEIRPFIKQILETPKLSFLKNMQSQDINDYEIFCKLCKEGYSLIDGLCIPECPKSCLECELINMELKCVGCLKIENKIQLTIVDNQCIQCPNKCTLCRQRNDNEIFAINPQFKDKQFIINSYQCLQSVEDEKLFYDNEIGRFIQCEQDQFCSNEITINLNLICSETEYNSKLNELTGDDLKSEFQQRNILVKDLFSTTSSFQQFQNPFFYLSANDDTIKAFKIIIESSQQQICQVEPFTKLEQKFAEHIFSLKYVELQLDFKQQVEFQLKGEIQILNFHKIIFRNVIFTSIKSNYDKFIKFESIYQSQIQFYNFQLNQQSINQVNTILIIITNVSKLEIFNFLIQNLFLNEQNNLFSISQQSFQKTIIFNDIQIKNCIINNQNMFNFYIKQFDSFVFDNLTVLESTFNHSILMKINKYDTSIIQNLEIADILISNMILNLQVFNSQSLIQIESYQKVQVSNLSISNSLIVNSTIMKLNNEINLYDFNLSYSELKLDSIIFLNVEQLENVTLKMMNLFFYKNQYDSTIHFIYFRKLNLQFLLIDIKNIILTNNIGTYFSRSYKDFEKSLIFIEANQILIEGFYVFKGYGINELFIKEANHFILLNSEISQDNQFKFQGLHQNLDCVLRKLQKLTYVQVISIYSTKKTDIQNMKISNLRLVNFPIILYKSAEVEIKEQQEIFQMKNIIIKNNILLQTDSIVILSIIFISSQQVMQIYLNNIKFQNNLYHSYRQNHLKKSSTLINIDSFQSQFSLNNSMIQNNLVTNSTDSIIYINCQSIQINLCDFQFNSIFNYQILYSYIQWGFSDEIIYQEQIELIFPVISETGNGLLVGQNISIFNINIEESKGQQGGAFKILGQNDSTLKFKNIILNKIGTIFSQQTEFGGAFHIDGSQTQTIKVEFEQIKGQNIYCKNFGGFLYLKFSNQYAKIFMSNLYMKNIQSQIGSLVYLDFTSLANNQQSLIMSNITIISSQESFERYLTYFKIFLQDDINQIKNNRTLIYSDYGTDFSFHNLDIISLFQEGLFQINGIQSIIIYNVKVMNSNFKGSLIKIIPFQYLQQFITIKDLNIEKINQLSYQFNYTCLQKLKEIKPIEYICLSSEVTAPQYLDNYLLDLDFENQSKICFNNSLQNDELVVNQGLIIITALNDISKINLGYIFLEQIDCSNCEKGLIYLQIQSTYESVLQTSFYEHIKIKNSICGYEGCFNFEKQSSTDSQNKRYLNTIKNIIWQSEIYIHDFICKNNTATFGTCLAINNLKCILYQSKLISNTAKYFGGAIYLAGKQLFLINNCQIINNAAFTGGGLYFVEEHQTNYSKYQNLIFNNSATFFGNDYKLNPEGLSLYIQNNIPLDVETIFLNSTLKIVKAGHFLQQHIKLPCGQQLNSYQYFDPQKRIYQNSNIYFRIRPVQFDFSWSKQLDNTFCVIQSRLIDIKSDNNSFDFTNNFTNIKKVFFDSIEQEYTLENLIIYFDSDVPQEIFLQLDFQCNSVSVPSYDDNFPYKLISHHSNYHLRVNIKTLPCQYGEIKNQTDLSCHLCDAEQGFFSLKLNQPRCELKDEISTLSVKPALLELKSGYWRPYFDQNQITYCYNLPSNCLGGWIEGDSSCLAGHIGALCEQCDVHNIRGDGNFASSEKFYCGSCSDQSKNITIIVLTVIWTLLTLFFSVQGNLKMLDEFSKPQLTYQQKLTFQLNQPKTGILMKMVTNYFQIISSLATFQLNFSVGIESFLNIAGNPIQTTANSQDCFLKDLFSIEIQYARTLWLIIMPFLYIGSFMLFYLVGTYLKLTQNFNWSMIITSILHTYIYFQPNVIGGLMQLLSFREISGYQWVKANVSTRFDSELHYKWMFEFALPILIILALIIPFLLFYFLFKNKQILDQKRMRKILGYLYHEYKPQAYFWEILKIFQKEFIIIFLNFYEENIVLKGILVLLTSYAYSLLNSQHKPFQSSSLNKLDQASTNVCTISFGLAIGLYVTQQQKIFELQIPFWIILSYYNIIFLVQIIYKIFIEYFKNFQKAIDDVIKIIGAKFPFLFRFKWTKKFIEKRLKSKSRTKYLISKLQNYLLPIAKNSLSYKKILSKNYQSQQISLGGENWKWGKLSQQNSGKYYFENDKGDFFQILKQKYQLHSNAIEEKQTEDK